MELKVESLSFLSEASYNLDGISILCGKGHKEAIAALAEVSLDCLYDEVGKKRKEELKAIRALLHYASKGKADLTSLKLLADELLKQAHEGRQFAKAISESAIEFDDPERVAKTLSVLFDGDIEPLFTFEFIFASSLKPIAKAQLSLTPDSRLTIQEGGKKAVVLPQREGEDGLAKGKVVDLEGFKIDGPRSPLDNYLNAEEEDNYLHVGDDDLERCLKEVSPYEVSESGFPCLGEEELPLDALEEGEKTIFALLKAFRTGEIERGGYVFMRYPEIGLEEEGLKRLCALLLEFHSNLGVNFVIVSSSKELLALLGQAGAKAIEIES